MLWLVTYLTPLISPDDNDELDRLRHKFPTQDSAALMFFCKHDLLLVLTRLWQHKSRLVKGNKAM